tara:strand:- start:431 stop:628 length:198 start_codon:yes stop_codon:yes gene_type:complete
VVARSELEEKSMDSMHWLLSLIVIGFILLCVGFNYRDRNWGVGLLGLGVLTMFSTLAFKMYITFY